MSESGRVQRGIDRQIEEALKQGKFENLPGKGKPIRPESLIQADDDHRLAYKILKDNDFVLPWMEKGRRIDQELDAARKALTQSWQFYRREGQVDWVVLEWQRAQSDFRRRVSELNVQIRDYNLEIPNLRFERFLVSADAEIEKIQKNG